MNGILSNIIALVISIYIIFIFKDQLIKLSFAILDYLFSVLASKYEQKILRKEK